MIQTLQALKLYVTQNMRVFQMRALGRNFAESTQSARTR